MITTKAGYQVKIVGGSKKSITGTKPFLLEYIVDTTFLLRNIAMGAKIGFLNKPFKLQRNALLYDNEQELYDGLGLEKTEQF